MTSAGGSPPGAGAGSEPAEAGRSAAAGVAPAPPAAPAAPPAAADPAALIRSPSYLGLLAVAALIGAPVSAVAFGFLKLVGLLQGWFFGSVPREIGFHEVPVWWPLPMLAVAGLLVSATIKYLPGTAGHSPADGFQAGGVPEVIDLPGVFVAALATLSLGVVLGPEAPLIAIGGTLGVIAVRLARREAPPAALTVMAAAGSFAAVSTLFGSPIAGAFLLMEAVGLGGPMLGLVLVPGLLASGIGTLVFIGLGSLSGFGTFSLAIPGLPPFAHPTAAMLAWAPVFGVVAAFGGTAIRLLGLALRTLVARHSIPFTVLAGLAVAGLAVGFAEASGRSSQEVLFSGQTQLPGLVGGAAGWTVGALALLVLCKSLAYGISLSSFRGGPVFPALFIGAAGGIAASHLPGLSLVPGVAMGIGAMSTAMLKLPFSSTLLATLILYQDGLTVMPVVIVAVVVTYVVSAWLPTSPEALAGWWHRKEGGASPDAGR